MKLHTNSLTAGDIRGSLTVAKVAGQVSRSVTFNKLEEHGSRSHARAFEVQLGTETKYKGDGRRRQNSGTNGAQYTYAATWDEWGWFIAEIFEIDPRAKFGPYNGVKDFNEQTKYKFATDNERD